MIDQLSRPRSWIAAAMLLALLACGGPRPVVDPSSVSAASATDFPGVHNAVAFGDGLISGGVPEGDAGFDTLARLGVGTIISVDGAVPDVARAERRGMRYVHLPIGYNGFDEPRRLQIIRATRDGLERGTVYIHCHHGKHRGAAAAAAAAVGLGKATPDAMVERMKVAGTSPSYSGLYACVRAATPVGSARVDAVNGDFPSVSRPTGMVEGMVEVDEILDRLRAIEAAGWRAPADHPDLVPAAEAARLGDVFRELAALGAGDAARRRPEAFVQHLITTSALATEIEDRLLARPTDPAGLSARLAGLAASCKDCHVRYRD